MLSALRQALLTVEHGAAIAELDSRRDDQHDGGEQDERQCGGQHIDEPFEHDVGHARAVAVHAQQRRMEKRDRFCAAGDDLADIWRAVDRDSLKRAELHDRPCV